MERSSFLARAALRRLAGIVWLGAWCAVLWVIAAPWRALGGLVSERLRWLEWWALCAGVALGFTIGRAARERGRATLGRGQAAAVRLALYPPAVIAGVALVALTIIGERGPIGVVVTAFLSYWAGFDAAIGAVPLMEGEPLSPAPRGRSSSSPPRPEAPTAR
jgi:hypothetical protein